MFKEIALLMAGRSYPEYHCPARLFPEAIYSHSGQQLSNFLFLTKDLLAYKEKQQLRKYLAVKSTSYTEFCN